MCKACDRCRLKKSKCDGVDPCLRCRADNATCIFGQRKKVHEKSYPKGYAEMLEQQQVWLVSGLQELYNRAVQGQGWPGEPLKLEPNGFPLTHDMLVRLGALNNGAEKSERQTNITLQQEPANSFGQPALGTPSIRSCVDSFQQTIPLTPMTPSESPSDIKIFNPERMLRNSHFELQRTDISDQWGSQDAQQWCTADFGLFDNMEMMIAAKDPNLLFDDPSIYEKPDLFTDQNAAGITLI